MKSRTNFRKQRIRLVEEACQEAHTRFFFKVRKELSPFVAGIPSRKIPEGTAVVQGTPDGGFTSDLQTITSCVEVNKDVERETRVDEYLTALCKGVEQMTSGQAGMVFKTLKEALGKTGQMQRGGSPLDFDILLSELEKVDMDFSSGSHGLQIVCGPDLGRKLEEKQREWMCDSEKKRRFEEMMRKKHDQWLRREHSRRLVD